MIEFLDFFKYIFNLNWIFLHFGNIALYIILLIIFAETGLFIGFFLPGDSLLFTAGIFGDHLSKNFYNIPFTFIILLVSLASILGNMMGYIFGYQSGPLLYKRKNSFFFNRQRLIIAKLFYNKYKTLTLIISRFLPILRTFSPIIAGIVRINFKEFMTYNILGGLIWSFSIMLAGYYLDKIYPQIKNNIEYIILLIVLITTFPIIIKVIIHNRKK